MLFEQLFLTKESLLDLKINTAPYIGYGLTQLNTTICVLHHPLLPDRKQLELSVPWNSHKTYSTQWLPRGITSPEQACFIGYLMYSSTLSTCLLLLLPSSFTTELYNCLLCCTKPDSAFLALLTLLAFSISVFLSPHWFSLLHGSYLPCTYRTLSYPSYSHLTATWQFPKVPSTYCWYPNTSVFCLDYKPASSSLLLPPWTCQSSGFRMKTGPVWFCFLSITLSVSPALRKP